MTPYTVILRDANGAERTETVVASTAQSASNQGLLRVTRATGRQTWAVVSATEKFYGDAVIA